VLELPTRKAVAGPLRRRRAPGRLGGRGLSPLVGLRVEETSAAAEEQEPDEGQAQIEEHEGKVHSAETAELERIAVDLPRRLKKGTRTVRHFFRVGIVRVGQVLLSSA